MVMVDVDSSINARPKLIFGFMVQQPALASWTLLCIHHTSPLCYYIRQVNAVNTGGYTGCPKNLAPFFSVRQILTDFHNYFTVRIRRKFVIKLAKDPTTPQVCRYTTLWNVSVIKAVSAQTARCRSKVLSFTGWFLPRGTGSASGVNRTSIVQKRLILVV